MREMRFPNMTPIRKARMILDRIGASEWRDPRSGAIRYYFNGGRDADTRAKVWATVDLETSAVTWNSKGPGSKALLEQAKMAYAAEAPHWEE